MATSLIATPFAFVVAGTIYVVIQYSCAMHGPVTPISLVARDSIIHAMHYTISMTKSVQN
jgi:hypothetical protein